MVHFFIPPTSRTVLQCLLSKDTMDKNRMCEKEKQDKLRHITNKMSLVATKACCRKMTGQLPIMMKHDYHLETMLDSKDNNSDDALVNAGQYI